MHRNLQSATKCHGLGATSHFWFESTLFLSYCKRGEEQNREEGEMAQKKLGGVRNRGKSRKEGEKCEVNV